MYRKACLQVVIGALLLSGAAVTGPAVPETAAKGSKEYHYDFGSGRVEKGYTKVKDNTAYTKGRGYGFADVSKVKAEDRDTSDELRSDFVTMNGTSFIVDVPNGDYSVTVIAGDEEAALAMDIYAEGHKEALGLTASAGQYAEVTFAVAVIDGRLDLELQGTDPRLNALTLERLPERTAGDKPNVYLAGDSTVMSYPSRYYPMAGWGQRIAEYFTDGVTFTNKAIGGRSSKSFVMDGRLDTILTEIRPGDYLFVQFGHNDASSVPERHTEPFTTYKEYLTMYIDGARQRNAEPVLVTPVGRRSWDENGRFKNDFPDYWLAMKQVAEEKQVPLLDLNSRSIAFYDTVGMEETKALFFWLEPGAYPNWPDGTQDNTHFQEAGALAIAKLVSEGIRDLELPIKAYLK
nr:GDSL-type esterase/lipase family protein [Paenibacillus turpanensis]